MRSNGVWKGGKTIQAPTLDAVTFPTSTRGETEVAGIIVPLKLRVAVMTIVSRWRKSSFGSRLTPTFVGVSAHPDASRMMKVARIKTVVRDLKSSTPDLVINPAEGHVLAAEAPF
jgi:hypothetical protein